MQKQFFKALLFVSFSIALRAGATDDCRFYRVLSNQSTQLLKDFGHHRDDSLGKRRCQIECTGYEVKIQLDPVQRFWTVRCMEGSTKIYERIVQDAAKVFTSRCDDYVKIANRFKIIKKTAWGYYSSGVPANAVEYAIGNPDALFSGYKILSCKDGKGASLINAAVTMKLRMD